MNPFKALILLLALVSACVQDVPSNDVIFEMMWTDFDENYAGFEARNIDWDAVYEQYAEQAQASSSDDELWRVMTETLDVLYDAHVYLERSDGTGFESGTLRADPNIEFEYNSDVAKSYLESDLKPVSSKNDFAFYGMIAGENIGYVSIRSFSSDESGWEDDIDPVVEALQNTDGVIIDLRNNPGGADNISQRLAGAFTQSVALAFTKRTKNGPGRNDFDEPIEFFSQPAGASQYTKAVAVLINSYSASAAEVFGLYLQTQEHVTFVGIPTATAFSDVSFTRFLPNGWFYTLSHQLYSYADGTSPEGVGILPDIALRNAPDDVADGTDAVLERGIDLLR